MLSKFALLALFATPCFLFYVIIMQYLVIQLPALCDFDMRRLRRTLIYLLIGI